MRLTTSGATLAMPAGAADTTILVATVSPYRRWTIRPQDLPLPLLVGGEQMTATSIEGEASPQTLTVVRGVGAVAHPAGTAVWGWPS